MIKGIEVILAVLFLCVSISFTDCSQTYKRATQLPEHPFLLYIEDIDGHDGIYAGNFGEVVCWDIKTQNKFILTKDHYFDANPHILSDNKTLVLQSKRKFKGEIGDGLGISDKLFKIDIQSGKAKILDVAKYSKFAYDKESYLLINSSAVAHHSNKMVFAAEGLLDEKSRMYVYDISRDTLNILIPNKTTSTAYKIVWSDDDSIIAFNKGNQTIRLYTINKALLDSITESEYTPDLGDIRHDTLVYCAKDWTNKKNFIFLVDLKTKIKKTIYTDTTDLSSPCFDDNGIVYFIKVTENKVRDGYYPQDIFSCNIVTGQICRITSDEHAKEDLKWISRKE